MKTNWQAVTIYPSRSSSTSTLRRKTDSLLIQPGLCFPRSHCRPFSVSHLIFHDGKQIQISNSACELTNPSEGPWRNFCFCCRVPETNIGSTLFCFQQHRTCYECYVSLLRTALKYLISKTWKVTIPGGNCHPESMFVGAGCVPLGKEVFGSAQTVVQQPGPQPVCW